MSPKPSERELLDRIARLPREVRPRRDPWAGIAQRLDAPSADPQAWTPGPLLRMAAALAAVAVALGVVFSGPGRIAPTPGPDALAGPPLIAGSEAEYLAAFREFLPLGEARERLAVGTVETIEDSWSALVRAEQSLRTALDDNPGNAFLNQRMLELRARQLGFLRQLAGLDHSNRRMST